MSKVLGKNVILKFFDSGQWKTYACGRSVSLDVATDFIETSVAGSGIWRTMLPVSNSWTGTADGIVNLDMAGTLSLADLRQKQYSHERLQIRFEREDQDSNVYTETGFCYISGSSDSGSFDDLNLFNVSLQGTGALTQVFTPTTNLTGNKVKRYPEIGTTHPPVPIGDTVVSLPALAGKDILGVWKDGLGDANLILSGTPVGREVLYDEATGDFTFGIPFDGETYMIFYQNK